MPYQYMCICVLVYARVYVYYVIVGAPALCLCAPRPGGSHFIRSRSPIPEARGFGLFKVDDVSSIAAFQDTETLLCGEMIKQLPGQVYDTQVRIYPGFLWGGCDKSGVRHQVVRFSDGIKRPYVLVILF